MSNIIEQVKQLVEPILDENHFELVDIEYVKEGQDWFLRVYIDKPGGIDIDECVLVSEKLSELLDIHDPIEEAYFLEVSSPGAERPMKKESDWQTALDNHQYINISLYQKVDKEKQYQGYLVEMTDDFITLEIKDKTRLVKKQFERKNIAKARLAIEF